MGQQPLSTVGAEWGAVWVGMEGGGATWLAHSIIMSKGFGRVGGEVVYAVLLVHVERFRAQSTAGTTVEATTVTEMSSTGNPSI